MAIFSNDYVLAGSIIGALFVGAAVYYRAKVYVNKLARRNPDADKDA